MSVTVSRKARSERPIIEIPVRAINPPAYLGVSAVLINSHGENFRCIQFRESLWAVISHDVGNYQEKPHKRQYRTNDHRISTINRNGPYSSHHGPADHAEVHRIV